jgi:sulfate adenylyltransferase subunit 1 (EFTu-like GTPase family)
MVTAASTSDAAVLLVDATEGLKPQTRRHAWLARWAGVTHAVLAVNKMDLVGYDEHRFVALDREFRELAADLGFTEMASIPLSALDGDMVVERGDAMPWYDGPTLLEWLEGIDPLTASAELPLRLPVQRIARVTASGRVRRAVQGTIASGGLAIGDEILVAPSLRSARIAAIANPDGPVSRAHAGDAVTVELDRELDIARGDLLAAAHSPPRISRELAANLVWFDDEPLATAATYLVKHGARTVRAHFAAIERGVDIATLKPAAAPAEVAMNALVHARLKLHEPLAFDPFTPFRATGAFIVIDESTFRTVAAGTIEA